MSITVRFKSEPHGEHEVQVEDPEEGMANSIIVIKDSFGHKVAMTGEELLNIVHQVEVITDPSKRFPRRFRRQRIAYPRRRPIMTYRRTRK